MGQLIPLFNSHLSQFQETNNTSCFLINAQEQPLIGSQLVTCYLRMLIKLRNKPLRYSILCYVAKSSSCGFKIFLGHKRWGMNKPAILQHFKVASVH